MQIFMQGILILNMQFLKLVFWVAPSDYQNYLHAVHTSK